MSPVSIVRKAKSMGLNAIALTDHNCAFNLPAFAEICARESMDCLFGMEVTSVEEAHVLCLFDDLQCALEMGQRVYESLPAISNRPEHFGDQPIIDENETVLGFAEKLLISASPFDVSTLLGMVHEWGGLFIPAHIDRRVYGIISQLGFLPEEAFDAVELTAHGDPTLARHYPIVRNSDSHELSAVGRACTELDVESLRIQDIRSFLWNGLPEDSRRRD
jgi:PHP family Zn ribbon phosphoesterase